MSLLPPHVHADLVAVIRVIKSKSKGITSENMWEIVIKPLGIKQIKPTDTEEFKKEFMAALRTEFTQVWEEVIISEN